MLVHFGPYRGRSAPTLDRHSTNMPPVNDITVGIDIGTTSVKAVAADGEGNVVASARVPHDLRVPSAEAFEHDVDAAWRRGDVDAVNVAAMVPSLGAFRADGTAAGPGLLYGDHRGRSTGAPGASPAESGELYG